MSTCSAKYISTNVQYRNTIIQYITFNIHDKIMIKLLKNIYNQSLNL